MFTWFAAILRLPALGRRSEFTDRAAVLTLFARATDEWCSGLLVVLTPTLRLRLGLDVQQLAWCFQAMSTTAAVVEPLAAAAVDVLRRRPLLVCGAGGWGAALMVAAGGPSYGWLLAAFVLIGATSGALTHTADIVLVEAHPDAVERIASRSTLLDTVGALSAPVAVTLASWWGADATVLLRMAGVGTLVYAGLLAATAMPTPPAKRDGGTSPRVIVDNVGRVLHDRSARRAMGALALFELLDPLELFEPVWLTSVAGASQAFVALHLAVELAASVVALALLDRWLADHDATPVLVLAGVGSLVTYTAWLLVPGLGTKLLLVVLRSLAMAPLWPILRSRALAALPGTAGAVAGITALLGLVPASAAIGWVAGRFGLTPTLLVAATAGFGGLVRLATAPTTEQIGA